MKWIIMFRQARNPEKSRFRTVCGSEGDLQGEKERLAMELERETGESWICARVISCPERGGGAGR